MFVISRHQGWCLRNRTSTQTTTATSASTYSAMAARLPIVPFYRVIDLLASPATFHQFRGDKPDKSGGKVVITDKELSRAARSVARPPNYAAPPASFRP